MDLADLINDISWDEFRQTDEGNIWVHAPTLFDETLVKFSYRVGLHLKRPMEAIMAQGLFIRMRGTKDYDAFELSRLDPENPDTCYYSNQPYYNPNTDSLTKVMYKRWQPRMPKGYTAAQQHMLAAQQAALQAQQGLYVPYNTGLGGPYNTGLGDSGGGGWATNTTNTINTVSGGTSAAGTGGGSGTWWGGLSSIFGSGGAIA